MFDWLINDYFLADDKNTGIRFFKLRFTPAGFDNDFLNFNFRCWDVFSTYLVAAEYQKNKQCEQ